MTLRLNNRQLVTLCVLASFAIRAFAPLGYMPSTSGSGLFFELCPEQLPAGFVVSNSSSSHNHHNHSDSDTPTTEKGADQCQVGHLLLSALAIDTPVIDGIDVERISEYAPITAGTVISKTASAYRSRAPPA